MSVSSYPTCSLTAFLMCRAGLSLNRTRVLRISMSQKPSCYVVHLMWWFGVRRSLLLTRLHFAIIFLSVCMFHACLTLADFVSDQFRLRNCATGQYLCVKGQREQSKVKSPISLSGYRAAVRMSRELFDLVYLYPRTGDRMCRLASGIRHTEFCVRNFSCQHVHCV